MYFVFTKGAKKTLSADDNWTDAKAAWIAAIMAVGMGVLVAGILLPILRHRSSKMFNE
jgi:sodium-dependent phosphate transporter